MNNRTAAMPSPSLGSNNTSYVSDDSSVYGSAYATMDDIDGSSTTLVDDGILSSNEEMEEEQYKSIRNLSNAEGLDNKTRAITEATNESAMDIGSTNASDPEIMLASGAPRKIADAASNAVAASGWGLPITKREVVVYSSLEEFEGNMPSTVTLLQTPHGSKVYLVGTAHYSHDSQDDVSEVIRNVRPDFITVELCQSRLHIIKLSDQILLQEVKNLDILKAFDIIKLHGCVTGILYLLLLQMSAQVAKDLVMAPGGEFRRAYEEFAHLAPHKCVFHLGDRPIHITLKRVLHALSMWQIAKLVWRVIFSDPISREEVEKCKNRDLLESILKEMAGEFPAFSEVFVKERDLFLCHSLQLAASQEVINDYGSVRPVRVVGVVGIGHADGIAKLWGQVTPEQISYIKEIPSASLSTRIFVKTIKYGFLGLMVFGAFKIVRPRLSRFI